MMLQKKRGDEFLAALPLNDESGKAGKKPPAKREDAQERKAGIAAFRKQYAEYLFGEIDKQHDNYEKMFADTGGFKTMVATGIISSITVNEKQKELIAAHSELQNAYAKLANSALDIYGCVDFSAIAKKN